MASPVTTASNISNTVGKWVPYYHKPFNLGRLDNGALATDGEIHITQTTGDSGVIMSGFCNSSANSNF